MESARRSVVSVAHVDEYPGTRNTAFSAGPRHLYAPTGRNIVPRKLLRSQRASVLARTRAYSYPVRRWSGSITLAYTRENQPRVQEDRKRSGESARDACSVSAGSFQVHREVFLEHETSFTSAGPGLALSLRLEPSPSRSDPRQGVHRPSSRLSSPSRLASRSRVANAPARSLHLLLPSRCCQILSPEQADRAIQKDTRAASFQLATNGSSARLSIDADPHRSTRTSPPSVGIPVPDAHPRRLSTFRPLFALNRTPKARPALSLVALLFRPLPPDPATHSFSRKPPRGFARLRDIAAMRCLPAFHDEMRSSFYPRRNASV